MIALRRTRRTLGRRLAVSVMFGACLPILAPQGQGVLNGTVRDEDGRPIAGARIELLVDTARLGDAADAASAAGAARAASAAGAAGAARAASAADAASAESDERGKFSLRLSKQDAEPATRRLSVRRIGFLPVVVDAVVAEAAVPDVTLTRAAQPLEAVVVQGREGVRGALAGFYARRELGHGRFFTADQVEQQGARRMTDLLRDIPGLRVRPRDIGRNYVRLRGATIAPLVWLDGVPMGSGEVDLDTFDPRTFAGIEVYSGAATVPVQFAGGRAMSTSGGTILLWSREGEVAAKRIRKRGQPQPSAIIARLLERGEAFTADQVSAPARALGPMLIPPQYPDALYDAGVAGRVEVEFVVDATGRPRMDTFGVVSASHPSLVEAVRRSLAAGRQQFVPAMLDGRATAQLVQQPFEFRLDGRPTPVQPKN